MSLAVLFVVVLPFVIGLYRKYSILIMPIFAAILLLTVGHVENMNRWLFIISLGICFADLDWFQKSYQWIRKNKKTRWIKRITIYLLFLSCIFKTASMRTGIYSAACEQHNIYFIIFILYAIFYKTTELKKVFMFLGCHCANILHPYIYKRGHMV